MQQQIRVTDLDLPIIQGDYSFLFVQIKATLNLLTPVAQHTIETLQDSKTPNCLLIAD